MNAILSLAVCQIGLLTADKLINHSFVKVWKKKVEVGQSDQKTAPNWTRNTQLDE